MKKGACVVKVDVAGSVADLKIKLQELDSKISVGIAQNQSLFRELCELSVVGGMSQKLSLFTNYMVLQEEVFVYLMKGQVIPSHKELNKYHKMVNILLMWIEKYKGMKGLLEEMRDSPSDMLVSMAVHSDCDAPYSARCDSA